MNQQIQNIEKQISNLNEEIRNIKGKTLIKCEGNCYGKGCGKRTQIRNLIYLDYPCTTSAFDLK